MNSLGFRFTQRPSLVILFGGGVTLATTSYLKYVRSDWDATMAALESGELVPEIPVPVYNEFLYPPGWEKDVNYYGNHWNPSWNGPAAGGLPPKPLTKAEAAARQAKEQQQKAQEASPSLDMSSPKGVVDFIGSTINNSLKERV